LIRQIETGKQKGYSEVDIIDGVIKAVVLSSSLRSYLDGRPDINLATLRSILRGHYAEKTPTTKLYSELASATQNPKESPNDFLLRVMDIRNRILFAYPEDSKELKYSPELVAGLFRRTVYTGLRDRTLRHEMRTHLDNVNISDAAFMHELNQLIIQESERQNKLQYKHSVSQLSPACTPLKINTVKEAVKMTLPAK
jgi:predicted secreted protein